MERVIVVGASGMLGREVVRALAAAGHAVVPTSRRHRPGWLSFDAERDSAASLARHGTVAVNCAATLASDILPEDPRSLEVARRVNTAFPHELAATGIRLVHISTDAVFRPDAVRCVESDPADAVDPYGRSKRDGEPDAPNALTLRCSFVGRDPGRRRGLVEWVLAHEPGTTVTGWSDQRWNGLASTQVAAVCAALADGECFDRARREGSVHHLHEDPATTKEGVIREIVDAFELDLRIDGRPSGSPVTRTLGSDRRVLAQQLQSLPGRAASLAELAKRRDDADG